MFPFWWKILHSHCHTLGIICSDSASVLMTLKENKLGAQPDLVVELLGLFYKTVQASGSVGFHLGASSSVDRWE